VQVNKSFSGGRDTAEEQRKFGANVEVGFTEISHSTIVIGFPHMTTYDSLVTLRFYACRLMFQLSTWGSF
jgi:hypothetical protein